MTFTIRYLFDAKGGFLYGDDEIAGYAYPTSQYAVDAKRFNPVDVARVALRQERKAVNILGHPICDPKGDLLARNKRWLDRLTVHGVSTVSQYE